MSDADTATRKISCAQLLEDVATWSCSARACSCGWPLPACFAMTADVTAGDCDPVLNRIQATFACPLCGATIEWTSRGRGRHAPPAEE